MRHFELNTTNLLRKCNDLKYDFLFIALFFRTNYDFLNIFFKKTIINLVSLQSHDRVVYCNGKYLEKRSIKVQKNEAKNFQLFI